MIAMKLFEAISKAIGLSAVKAEIESRKRKSAEEAFRLTAEALKESGRTKEQILDSLRQGSGLEGVAPYFGITPKEIDEARRARVVHRAEAARKVAAFGEAISKFKKKPGEPDELESSRC